MHLREGKNNKQHTVTSMKTDIKGT